MILKSTFVVGGAASGKSAYAESLVLNSGKPRVYLASMQAHDTEMQDKIAAHREMRGAGWRTVECPLDAVAALAEISHDEIVLFDCATMWLSNHLLAGSDLGAESRGLLAALDACRGQVVVVSNEVGMGIVPENALARRFRNEQGRLNQRLAAQSDCVVTVIAGLPLALKGALP
ncbi:bifunctional adenosylcobinamide kinase/adenosylcobinamide-phosphate guanylyltransferase [Shimia sp.]|uniref:bifunctional adenosylcobinamide kinase/adenosylcobinamide-phosphate guanylyltransferase n=1 Tax=Shimia sp. TaxID=1954381 RepID=UPI003563A409